MKTKSEIKSYIKQKLSTNHKWAMRALIKIYEFQTADEQHYKQTSEHNKVGFTGVDANILSSFAKQVNKGYNLSQKQMTIVFKKMPKYWNQILSLIPQEKLYTLNKS